MYITAFVEHIHDLSIILQSITTLCLYHSEIRDGGVKFIAKALIENKVSAFLLIVSQTLY